MNYFLILLICAYASSFSFSFAAMEVAALEEEQPHTWGNKDTWRLDKRSLDPKHYYRRHAHLRRLSSFEQRGDTCFKQDAFKSTYRRKAINAHKDGKTCHHFHHVQGQSQAMKDACSSKLDKTLNPDPKHQVGEIKGNLFNSSSPITARDSNAYKLVKSYSGSTFFDGMTFFTQTDPSGGMIQYLDQEVAQQQGLIGTKNDNAFMKFGSRNDGIHHSVRISTKDTFTTGIFILDAYHMPTGCGVWPSFWTTPANPQGGWPNGGEIDLIEGVHYFSRNMYSIHAPSFCSMSQPLTMQGTLAMPDPSLKYNCDPHLTDDQGCGVRSEKDGDFGQTYNQGGGGVHALVWDSENGIHMYFFPREKIPQDIKIGSPNPNGWGEAVASYPARTCKPDDYFQSHSAVFSNTICGTWAGAQDVWTNEGGGQDEPCSRKTGKSSCYEYVLSGADLTSAYWEIASLKIYQLIRRK